MKHMVGITFNLRDEQQRAEVAALLPKEQEHVKRLTEQGIIEALYVSADRSHVWIVMQGESPEQVRQELTSFPLHPYMQSEVTPLL